MADPGGFVPLYTSALLAAFTSALAEANSATSRQLSILAENLSRGVGADERQAAHQYLGRRAQQAVLNSYDQVVTARERSASLTHYRSGTPGRNHRYAARALRNALAAPGFFEATPDELRMINITELNRAARQWARLNFGAGSLGQGSRRHFEVTFSNVVVLVLDLNQGPRPAFTLPRGYWFGSEGEVAAGANPAGTDAFYPLGTGTLAGLSGSTSRKTGATRTPRGVNPITGQGRPTRGIEARNFLDAGLARLAKDFAPTYARMYQRLFDQERLTTSSVRGVARPAPITYRVRTSRSFSRLG